MYSLVLATVLTAGADTPDWCRGRCGCYGGGCYCGCYGGCYGCNGCYRCSCGGYSYCGCYCNGYSGCYSCGCGCYSYCGCSCYCGCYGNGYYGNGYGNGYYGNGYANGYGNGYYTSNGNGYHGNGYYANGNGYYANGNGYSNGNGYYPGTNGSPRVIIQEPGNGNGKFSPPPPADPSVAPQNDFEREAIRRVLEELRKKGGETGKLPVPAVPGNMAQVTVRLPAQARLYVDNVTCPLTSDTRTFKTPRLEPGRQYFYTLRMEVNQGGQTVRENRRIEVAAGQRVQVDFNTVLTSTAQPTAQR